MKGRLPSLECQWFKPLVIGKIGSNIPLREDGARMKGPRYPICLLECYNKAKNSNLHLPCLGECSGQPLHRTAKFSLGCLRNRDQGCFIIYPSAKTQTKTWLSSKKMSCVDSVKNRKSTVQQRNLSLFFFFAGLLCADLVLGCCLRSAQLGVSL